MIAVNIQFDDILGSFYLESSIVEGLNKAVHVDNVSLLPPNRYIAEELRKLYNIDYPDGYSNKEDLEDVSVSIRIDGHRSSFTCIRGVAKAIVTCASFGEYKILPIENEISNIIRRMIPAEVREPTEKAFKYARSLSLYFGVKLPENAEKHKGECSDFISTYDLRYRCAKYYKETGGNAKLTFRWFLAYCYYNEEIPNEAIIELLSLDGQEMLDDFLRNIGKWLSDFSQYPTHTKYLIIKIFNIMISEQYPNSAEGFINHLPSPDSE